MTVMFCYKFRVDHLPACARLVIGSEKLRYFRSPDKEKQSFYNRMLEKVVT